MNLGPIDKELKQCLEAIRGNGKENNEGSNRNEKSMEEMFKHMDLPMLYVLKDNIDAFITNYSKNRELFETYNGEITKVNSMIEKKVLPDVLNYSKWDALMLSTWILSLDKDFGVYKQDLLTNFRKQKFDGTCLKDLEKNDLIQFGISDFKHRTIIYNAIKSVVNGTFQTVKKFVKESDKEKETPREGTDQKE